MSDLSLPYLIFRTVGRDGICNSLKPSTLNSMTLAFISSRGKIIAGEYHSHYNIEHKSSKFI